MVLPDVVAIFKPCLCTVCNKRFPDIAGLKVHQDTIHKSKSPFAINNLCKQSLKSMSVNDLKCVLKDMGLSISGKKSIPLARLESAIAAEF